MFVCLSKSSRAMPICEWHRGLEECKYVLPYQANDLEVSANETAIWLDHASAGPVQLG